MNNKENWLFILGISIFIFISGFQIYELITVGSCTIAGAGDTDHVGKVYLKDLPVYFTFIAVFILFFLIVVFIAWRKANTKKK